MNEFAVGIDVGGTRVKSGAVARDGRMLFKSTSASDTGLSGEAITAQLEETVAEIRRKMGREPVGIGLGLTGGVDPNAGIVRLPGKMQNLEHFPLVPELSRRVGLPVIADNDGRLAMVAERAFGHARDVDWAICITLGTGVGSGVLVDGKILRDPHHLFGTQIGHITIDPVGAPLCLTGARGTAEMYCSATALTLAVRSGIQRGIPCTLADRYWKNAQSVDFAAVAEAARSGDALCLDELERWTERVGWLIVSAVHAYAPARVILSGGAVLASDLFLPTLQKHVDRHVFVYPQERTVPVLASEMVEFAGVLGAARLAFESFEER